MKKMRVINRLEKVSFDFVSHSEFKFAKRQKAKSNFIQVW
jgi:hypothetical protein